MIIDMKNTNLAILKIILITMLLNSCNFNNNNTSVSEIPAQVTKISSELSIEYTQKGNILIASEKYIGVIFTQQTMEAWPGGTQVYWTPTVDDIVRIEQGVESYLSQNNLSFHSGQAPTEEKLSNYRRQYHGLINESGKAIIVASYLCSWEEDSWKNGKFYVKGGGDCYFDLEYDPKEHIFISLFVNATR